MNAENILSVIKRKSSISKALKHIGMTGPGFYTSIRNNNIQVRILEELANYLEIDVIEFFTDKPIEKLNYVQEDKVEYKKTNSNNKDTDKNNITISQLVNIIEMKEKKEIDLIEIIKNQSFKHK